MGHVVGKIFRGLSRRALVLVMMCCAVGCEHDLVLGELPDETSPVVIVDEDQGGASADMTGGEDAGTKRDMSSDMAGDIAPWMAFEPVQLGLTFQRGLSTFDFNFALALTDVGGRLGCLAVENRSVFPQEDGAQLWSFFAHRRANSRSPFQDGVCLEQEILLVENDFCVNAFENGSDDDIDGDLYRCALLRRWRGRDVLPYHMARTGLLLFTTSPDDPSTCRAEVELVFEDGVQLEYTFEVKPEPDASTQCFERVEQKL